MTLDTTGFAAVETVPLRGVRRAAARHMIAAWEAPSFHLSVRVDMAAGKERRQLAGGVTVTDVIVEACAKALSTSATMNAWYEDMTVTRIADVNVGVAVASAKGLVVPVIKGADGLSLQELAERRRDLVERARSGTLTRADLGGGTFTISNLGMMGVDRFDAILNPPQVGILAVGATRQEYVLRQGRAEWRPCADFTLTCDHRALDGAEGAAFMASFVEHMGGNPPVD